MNFKPLNISAEFVCRIVFYFGRWNRLISTLDCHLCCNFVVIIQWPCVLRSVWLMMVEMHTALQLLVHQIPSPPFDRRGYENTMEAHGCWRNGMKNPLLFKIRALFLSFIHPQPPPSAFLHAPSQPSLFQITLREQEPVKRSTAEVRHGGKGEVLHFPVRDQRTCLCQGIFYQQQGGTWLNNNTNWLLQLSSAQFFLQENHLFKYTYWHFMVIFMLFL